MKPLLTIITRNQQISSPALLLTNTIYIIIETVLISNKIVLPVNCIFGSQIFLLIFFQKFQISRQFLIIIIILLFSSFFFSNNIIPETRIKLNFIINNSFFGFLYVNNRILLFNILLKLNFKNKIFSNFHQILYLIVQLSIVIIKKLNQLSIIKIKFLLFHLIDLFNQIIFLDYLKMNIIFF